MRCRRPPIRWSAVVFAVVGAWCAANSATAAPSWTHIASGLASPVEVAHAGDGSTRLFIAEQGGQIRLIKAGVLQPRPFLDLGGLTVKDSERGLLGIAFHPRYASNRQFYVNYTRAADGATVVARYEASSTDPDVANPASATVVLTIAQPYWNHNGGALKFGPDGHLYIGTGDGGATNDPEGRAQDVNSLLGKILRIDVDHGAPYAIPAGNPFAQGGGRPEIFAVGVRNPWRMSFDRATGDLWFGDVGQDAVEEIDRIAPVSSAGANFGWRVREGNRCTGLSGPVACTDSTLVDPVVTYGHDAGCSVTGGYVYRGTAVPALYGRYVYADFCSGRLWAAEPLTNGAWSPRVLGDTSYFISSFGEDEEGEMYFVDYTLGRLYKFEETAAVPVVEYYNARLDHYFVSALGSDIAALDAGRLPGWTRTGRTFNAYTTRHPGTTPVCRYYMPPAVGDSHFLSADPAECAAVGAKFPAFVLESSAAMHVFLPDLVTGTCPAATRPVYRLWNGRTDSNHRYTTDAGVRDEMVARGFVREGYGPNAVAMCAPL